MTQVNSLHVFDPNSFLKFFHILQVFAVLHHTSSNLIVLNLDYLALLHNEDAKFQLIFLIFVDILKDILKILKTMPAKNKL